MSKRFRAKQHSVYIVGELPLVEECADFCASKGYAVITQPNRSAKGLRSQARRKRSTAVTRDVGIALELTNIDLTQKKENLQNLDRKLLPASILLSSSVTMTATEQASWIRRPERLVGISALPTMFSQKLVEFAAAPSTTQESLVRAQDFFITLGKQVSVVQDRVGMVAPRILSMIINEAYFALQEGIASPQDVDVAMKLGTNHPFGPIEWGERIGLQQVSAVLRAVQNELGGDTYRIAPLLNQKAHTDVS